VLEEEEEELSTCSGLVGCSLRFVSSSTVACMDPSPGSQILGYNYHGYEKNTPQGGIWTTISWAENACRTL